MIAVGKARRLAAEGYRTLLVCFNQRLASDLDRELRDTPAPGGLLVTTFHRLCERLASQAGRGDRGTMRLEHESGELAEQVEIFDHENVRSRQPLERAEIHGYAHGNGRARALAQGTTLKVSIAGVQQGANITDSAIASGRAGVAYSSTAVTPSLDDWEAGDLTSGVVTPQAHTFVRNLAPLWASTR